MNSITHSVKIKRSKLTDKRKIPTKRWLPFFWTTQSLIEKATINRPIQLIPIDTIFSKSVIVEGGKTCMSKKNWRHKKTILALSILFTTIPFLLKQIILHVNNITMSNIHCNTYLIKQTYII